MANEIFIRDWANALGIVEPIENGSYIQSIARYYEVYSPVNGSYEQAISEKLGQFTTLNESWLQRIAFDFGQFSVINENWIQSIAGAASITILDIIALYDRVIADGGTFEAYNCLVGDINELLALDQIATTFNLRVLADSGTFEQINCLQTTITDLQNININ